MGSINLNAIAYANSWLISIDWLWHWRPPMDLSMLAVTTSRPMATARAEQVDLDVTLY